MPNLPRIDYTASQGEIDWKAAYLKETPDKVQPRAPLWKQPATPVVIKRVRFIVNPWSGGKAGQQKKQLQVNTATQMFQSSGMDVEVINTERAKHAREMMMAMALDVDAVVVLGGDGTVGEVVDGMLNRKDGKKVPIGVMPGGSGNAFLENLQQRKGGDGADETASIRAIIGGLVQKCDIGRVSYKNVKTEENCPRYFALLMGWGDAYEFMVHADDMGARWGLGSIRYHFEAGYRGYQGYPRRDGALTVDGKKVTGLNQVMVINVQDLFVQHYNPLGTADDGMMEAIAKPYLSGMQDLQLTGALMYERQFYDTPEAIALCNFHCKKLRLECAGAADDSFDRSSMVDGELIKDPCLPLDIDNVEGAVEFFVIGH